MSVIEVKGLSKSFGDFLVFKDISLDIDKGDALVIIGPSGCGKSTFLRCINRMENPTGGSINVLGEDILSKTADVDRLRERVGMVYQSFNLFSHLNVLENMILAPMMINRLPQAQAIREAKELLEQVGMEQFTAHLPAQLSGGQKQRVAIVRCLMMKPEILLFDEPTSALDPTMVDEVQSVIARLVREGMTSVIVTHEMDFARSVASRVAYFDDHGVYEAGTPEQIFDRPQRPKTQQFIERMDVFEREVSANADIYALLSEIRSFCIPYGFTNKQIRSIELILEEIGFAIVHSEPAQKCVFRLRCSKKTDTKDVVLEFPGMGQSPEGHPGVDELGLKLVQRLAGEIECRETKGGWSMSARI